MSIIIVTPKNRWYEIDDAYIILLSYFVGILIGKIYLKVRQKQLEKLVISGNPTEVRGGDLKFDVYREEQISALILECIEMNQTYLVLNQVVKRFIFYKVKRKITKESLSITSKTIRFLACQLFFQEKPLVVRVANFIPLSKNKTKLIF
jgi:hypothetical protein